MEQKKIKVYVVGEALYYARFIDDIMIVPTMENADIVLFTGGEDVDPILYGERRHPTTYFNERRDNQEIEVYSRSEELKVPLKIGICRGNQFLSVMNGTKLVQNVENHAGEIHSIITNKGEKYLTTSTHHQMVFPYNLDPKQYEIIAYANPTRSRFHEGSGINWKDNYKEVEIIYFPETNSLGIQGHPEMMNKNHDFVKYLNSLIKSKLK